MPAAAPTPQTQTATFPRDPRFHYAHLAPCWTLPMPAIPEAGEDALITAVRLAPPTPPNGEAMRRSLSALLLGVTGAEAQKVARAFSADVDEELDSDVEDLCERIANVLVLGGAPPPTVTVAAQTVTFTLAAPPPPTTPPGQVYTLWTSPGDLFAQLEAESRAATRTPAPPRTAPSALPRPRKRTAVLACGSPLAAGLRAAAASGSGRGEYVFRTRFRYRSRRERVALGVGEGDPFSGVTAAEEVVRRRLAFFGGVAGCAGAEGGGSAVPASRIPRPVRRASTGSNSDSLRRAVRDTASAGSETARGCKPAAAGAGKMPFRRGGSL